MGQLKEFKLEDKRQTQADTLRIASDRQRFRAQLSFVRFTDKDTNQIILFVPSLDLSSYGETEEKAKEMLKNSVTDCFQHMSQMSHNDLDRELAKLGWKRNKLKGKEFSRAYIDINGQLKNLNAVDDKIEHLKLTA